eukprot:scaffold126_cov246-Pinguiococcus_pyrenoidosus.AAC.9
MPLVDQGVSLCLERQDIEKAQTVLCHSGLPTLDPVRLRDLVDGITVEVQAEPGKRRPLYGRVVPRGKWEELIRDLLPSDMLSAADLKVALSFLSNLYGLLAQGEDVDIVYRFGLGYDLALCGLMTLGGGSKSLKLAELISACKDPRLRKVRPRVFERVFRGILTSLAAFTSGDRRDILFENEGERIVAVAGKCSSQILEGQDGADMETMKDFYNNAGGADLMNWLELLDLSKWIPAVALALSKTEGRHRPERAPSQEEPQVEPRVEPPPEAQREPEPPAPPDSPEQNPVPGAPSEFTSEREIGYEFSIEECSPPLHVTLSSHDVRALRLLVKTVANSMLRLVLGWARLDRHSDAGAAAVFDHIKHAVMKRADQQKLALDRRAFHATVRVIVDIDELERSDQSLCSAPLDSMFKSFDRTNAGSVNVLEFLIGYSVLCGGSKSAKLAFAFSVLDAHSTGELPKRELQRFFASFLTGISAFRLHSSDEHRREQSVAIDAAAQWTADKVFENAEIEDPEGGCTFNDIATWYGEEGHRVAPWLELLDLRKWIQEGEEL